MKNLTKTFLALAMLLLLMCFSSCGSNNPIVGKWEASLDDGIVTLDLVSDGTYTATNQDGNIQEGTYMIEEDKITINSTIHLEDPAEGRYTATFTYKMSGNELTLTNDENNSIVFIRK
jgi:hypothetical protein